MKEKIDFKYLELSKELLTKITPELLNVNRIKQLAEVVLDLAEKLQSGNMSVQSQ